MEHVGVIAVGEREIARERRKVGIQKAKQRQAGRGGLKLLCCGGQGRLDNTKSSKA